MNPVDFLAVSENIIEEKEPERAVLESMAALPDAGAWQLFPGADRIREHHFGKTVHLCSIVNGKSGKCSEDCAFCSQSAFAKTDAPIYPLMDEKALKEGVEYADQNNIHRYSVVTSGKRLPKQEVQSLARAYANMAGAGAGLCASLGILDGPDMDILKQAGVTRYHHNLETPKSHFDRICTTHSYQERVETIKAARQAGLEVCAGGIFGLGETDAQVLELALDLKDLDVDAVPVNFLVPIPGTALEEAPRISPLRCLKIIALMRHVLPDKEILVCGGRLANLRDLHSLVFYAGASGIMTGNYLTTTGREPEQDRQMIRDLGFNVREKV